MNFFKLICYTTILYLLNTSCSSIDKIKVNQSDKNTFDEAIRLAVNDYSTRKIKNPDNIDFYFVDIKSIDSSVYSFSITPTGLVSYYNKKYLTDDDIRKFPSHHIIVDDKLFYWWIEGSVGKKEDIELFEKFGFLVEDTEAYGLYADGGTYENQKISCYYFCKNDLSINARVHSNKLKDYFIIPESLNCKK